MLDKTEWRALVDDTMRAFVPFYQEAMQQAIQDSGVPDSWFGLHLARGSAPQPFTVGRYHAMFPYTSRERYVQSLEELAQLELLEKVGEDAYRLTDLGREKVKAIFKAAHRGLDTIQPLPAGEMDRLNGLLYRVVQATLEAPEPAEKWVLASSRCTDPGEGASGSVKMDQYLTDLIRYRDDAHLAAWKPYDVSGHLWEALTFVWRGDARTAEELTDKLPFRSHTPEANAAALAHLADRAWVQETDEGYQVTERGRAVRQQAEEATDRYFFAPWACLSIVETAQLHDLMTRLRNSLQEMAAGDENDADDGNGEEDTA
jgi:hypothetical protein